MMLWHDIVGQRLMWPGEGGTAARNQELRSREHVMPSVTALTMSCRLVFALRRVVCVEFNLFLRSRVWSM